MPEGRGVQALELVGEMGEGLELDDLREVDLDLAEQPGLAVGRVGERDHHEGVMRRV